MQSFTKTNKKNVLLYLGKFPGYGFDVDGGSILARQLIDSLKMHCNLSLVFIRKRKETYIDPYVKNITYVEYKNPNENKFLRRLQNLGTNRSAIGDYDKYDTIIVAHVSKLFGFEDMPISFWNKTILFPMFCTKSYELAGEFVPLEYTDQERFVINHVKTIITPSEIEMKELMTFYQIQQKKIRVVYRGINPLFKTTNKTHNLDKPQLVYIGSIKKQKNNIDALRVLYLLVKSGIDASINLVCTIHNNELFNELLSFIQEHQLNERVNFYFEQTQEQVAEIVVNSDINLSVSNWETFGRGIFEGISCGLPTFVFSKLEGVRIICQNNDGVYFATDIEDMAQEIKRSIKSPTIYYHMSKSLHPLAEKLSYDREQKHLIDILLNLN